MADDSANDCTLMTAWTLGWNSDIPPSMPTNRRDEVDPLAGLYDPDGRIRAPAEVGTLSRFAEVRLIGEDLVFGGEGRSVTPTEAVALKLARLRDEDGDAPLISYAKRWGPMGFCRHGYPPRACGLDGCGPRLWFNRDQWQEGEVCEPLSAWRREAALARALLSAASQLREGEKVNLLERDHKQLLKRFPGFGFSSDSSTKDHRQTLGCLVTAWLDWGDVRPMTYWGEGRPGFHLTGNTLYAAIGVYIAFATLGGGIYICYACRKPHVRDRRPRASERIFCPACGRRAARRYAKKDYRKRKAHRNEDRVRT